jgi:uncharacterized membrane protein YfcA
MFTNSSLQQETWEPRRAVSGMFALAAGVGLASVVLVLAWSSLLSRLGHPASALVLAAVLLASTLSSIAGFAFSAICGVMLLQMMDNPVQVVQIMMVCSIAIQSLSVFVLWRDIDWRGLAKILIGGAAGLPFGVWLLLHLESAGFREAIGALLIAYASYVLLKRPITITRGGWLADICVGFTGGITGGLAGFPGATVTIWCGMRGRDKRRQRGVYQPFILIMQILGLALIAIMRGSTHGGSGFDPNDLAFVPAALLGTWFGLNIFGRMSDRVFALTVNLLLLFSGIGLLV